MEPMPAGSKMDPWRAKAKPISDGGIASGVTQLSGEKKTPAQLQPERGVRTCERNNSADTEVGEEGGRGDVPDAGAGIPLQPLMKTMVRQAVPLQPMEVHSEADIHLKPMEGTSCQSRWMPEGGCEPMGSPTVEQAPGRTCGHKEEGAHNRAGLLAGLVTLNAGAACS